MVNHRKVGNRVSWNLLLLIVNKNIHDFFAYCIAYIFYFLSQVQYLVKWCDYEEEDNSWVFSEETDCPDLIAAYFTDLNDKNAEKIEKLEDNFNQLQKLVTSGLHGKSITFFCFVFICEIQNLFYKMALCY